MRPAALILILSQVALTSAFAAGLRSGAFPLGVRGEWEWQRLPPRVAVTALDLALGTAAVAAYAAAAALALRGLGASPSRPRELTAVGGLLAAAVLVQLAATVAAPHGYGLTKWPMALHNPGSSGYYTVARRQIGDARSFLHDYPRWIERQDALHIGTHPPGLFLLAHGLLRAMEAHPGLARWVVDHAPGSVAQGFQVIGQFDPLPRADRAALTLTGALTLLACAATVVPLYLLARASGTPESAWAAAALWPLAPSAVLFQPAADTAFPLIATTALALSALAGRRTGRLGLAAAILAGATLAVGMAFTLAFLAVGLIAGLLVLADRERPLRQHLQAMAATGAGFLAPVLASWAITGANPFVIWWWNQRNHARFYVEYPRSYLGWVAANPVELAVGLGIPSVLAMAAGLWPPRRAPRPALAALAVLALLTFSGKNLSEVARLWLPMMPALLVAAGAGLTKLGSTPWTLGASVFLLGLETLVLEATIQVVYPV